MDISELADRLGLISEEEKAHTGFMDKYGSKFGNDAGIGTAILAEMNRRNIDTSAAEDAVQEIVDQLREEASALLDKLKKVEDSVTAAVGENKERASIEEEATPEEAPPPPEAEAPPMDPNMPPPEAGAPPMDPNMPPPEAGAPPMDPNMPPPEAGAPPMDPNAQMSDERMKESVLSDEDCKELARRLQGGDESGEIEVPQEGGPEEPPVESIEVEAEEPDESPEKIAMAILNRGSGGHLKDEDKNKAIIRALRGFR